MKLLTLAYEDGITIGEALNVSVTGMIVVLLILALLSVFFCFPKRFAPLKKKRKP